MKIFFDSLAKHTTWWLLGVTFLGLVLRLPLLGGSFWLDEAAQALESARPWHQQLELTGDFQPPLLHLLTHGAIQFSQTEWWLRLWGALIPGLAMIWLTGKIGSKIWSPRAGVLASFLLATSSLHVFYSQELRPYALPASLALLSWWLIVRNAQTGKKLVISLSTQDFVVFTVVSILGWYASYLYPFVWLSQMFYLWFFTRTPKTKIFLSACAVGLGFLPWVPFFLDQLAAGGSLRQALPGWEEVVSTPQLKSLPLVLVKFLFGVLDVEPTLPFLGSLGTLALGTGYLKLKLTQTSLKNSSFQLMLVWFLLPLIVIWLISWKIPVLQPKRVLYLLPVWYLLLTSFVSAPTVTDAKTKTLDPLVSWASRLVIFVMIGVNLWSLGSYYTQPKLQRENWRGLHQEITERYPQSRTIIVSVFSGPFASWEWYDQKSYQTLSLTALPTESDDAVAQNLKPITTYTYVVLFDYLRDLTDPQKRVATAIMAYGFEEYELLDQPQIGFVRVFARKEAKLSSKPE